MSTTDDKPWPYPWPEPTGNPNSHYQSNGPENGAVFELDGHTFDVQPTNETGMHTGRMRFKVTCNTCKVELHHGTTSPPAIIRHHLRNGSAKSEPSDPEPSITVTGPHDDFSLGANTTVKRFPIRIEQRGKDRDNYERIRITQVVELSCEVLIPTDRGCDLCSTPAPLPDARGAAFILDNHDGERICFPYEESVKDERDQYPVTGWERIGDKLACSDCTAAFKEFAEKRKGRK